MFALGLFLGSCVPNLKFVSLTISELLAFNAHKFTGSRDPGNAAFWKKISAVMLGQSLGQGDTCQILSFYL